MPDGARECPECKANLQVFPYSLREILYGSSSTASQISAYSGISESRVTSGLVSLSDFYDLYVKAKQDTEVLRRIGVPPAVLQPLSDTLNSMVGAYDKTKNEFYESLDRRDERKAAQLESDLRKLTEEKKSSLDRSKLVASVVGGISHSNMLISKRIPSYVAFKDSMRAASVFHEGCSNEKEFDQCLGALASLFEVPLTSIKSQISSPDEKWKSIKLLEAWNVEKNKGVIPESVFKTWMSIVGLRSAKFPFHEDEPDIVDIVAFFGHKFPLDYERLWKSILTKFFESLEELQRALS